ncbi:hypothetical protein GQ55_4G176900 [Panicum hallii var. hallii]|uniref:CCHC-type domain-containing protein n=1 Tax=Panicum hallii var. hallii TaxID=1504633 RepID=A0A2T7DYS2_9POAL|nr:hypothetical protein GQ55_4G176900 [Panicum hallii var. hallii]
MGVFGRCGKPGHLPEACVAPVTCLRCKREGHVARVCNEVLLWECIAPFCSFAAAGQGFHIVQGVNADENAREMANCALITILSGEVSGRQLEAEFKAQAGPHSIWRWYAKKVVDNKY